MKKAFAIFFSMSLLCATTVCARDLVVSLPLLPPLVESNGEGIIVDLVRAMDKAYEEGDIIIKGPYPFIRSLDNVANGRSDFHMPILFNPLVPEEKLRFSHSTETIFRVDFAVYTNRSNELINPKNLSIFLTETDRGHTQYFDFDIFGSSSVESSLKQVSSNRIDAYVFSMTTTDIALKRLGLTNIKRWYYDTFDVKIALPKQDTKRAEIDRILTRVIKKLRKTGEYRKIMGPILWHKFSDTE